MMKTGLRGASWLWRGRRGRRPLLPYHACYFQPKGLSWLPEAFRRAFKLFSMATALPQHVGSKNDLQFLSSLGPSFMLPQAGMPCTWDHWGLFTSHTSSRLSPGVLAFVKSSPDQGRPLKNSPGSPLIPLLKHSNASHHKCPPSLYSLPGPELGVLTQAQNRTDGTLGPCSTTSLARTWATCRRSVLNCTVRAAEKEVSEQHTLILSSHNLLISPSFVSVPPRATFPPATEPL